MSDNEIDNGNAPASPDEAQTNNTDAPKDHRWKPGQSGNPKGRPKQPKTPAEVKALARSYTTQAVETLAKIMQNPKAPWSARTQASESLLARAWGRPPSTDLEGAEQLVIRVLKFGEQPEEPEMKLIEGEVKRDDDTETN